MALKSTYNANEKGADLTDRLDEVERLIERCKVLYEQYFMGIQKVAPVQIHRDVERKIRELTQENIRNTALRFRLTTVTQKFGSYNTYWRRIMREIEQGRYIRDIARIKRRAEATGEDIPDEILAAMPRRMREKILRDREKLKERAAREHVPHETGEPSEPTTTHRGVHRLDDALLGDDFDLDGMFEAITAEAVQAVERSGHVAPAADLDDERTDPRAEPAVISAPPPPPAARPPRPTTPAPQPRRPPPVPPPGMTEAQTRDLYDKYVSARKLVGDTSKVSYEQLMRTIGKQAPKIMKEHQAKAVEFNVVVKGDKVVLKAKPKK